MPSNMRTLNFAEEAQKVITIAQLAHHMDIDFDGISATCRQADSIGHILLPTEYRNSTGDYRRIGRLASALQAFMRLAQELDDTVINRHLPTTNQE